MTKAHWTEQPLSSARDPLAAVRAILRKKLEGRPVTVTLFGSWARGQQQRSSDIDVAIESPDRLPPELLSDLREALEESTVPQRVELVDLADADAVFRERVRREGVRWIEP